MSKLTSAKVNVFANCFKVAKLETRYLRFGSLQMPIAGLIKGNLSNYFGKDYLDFSMEYSVGIGNKCLELYIQLYENITGAGNKQYRLACYSMVGNKSGMISTINLTQNKSEDGLIYLIAKPTFSQQPQGHKEMAKAYRRMKLELFFEILNKLGLETTNNNEVIFGIFDLKNKNFANTTASRFLEDYLVFSILKGHFMANKGYEIELLPSFRRIHAEIRNYEAQVHELESKLPNVIKTRRAKRSIPLGLRYKVLQRDNRTCRTCGHTPNDGIKLQIDHIIPHSRGGLTTLDNLQALCHNCNLGKSDIY